jgi:hypothetical protein
MIWNKQWFINLIARLRKWQWFDTYIYGKSVDLEDFVRNPAEVLRDTYFPFIIKNVKTISVINLRCGYKSALNNPTVKNCWLVPMGDRKYVWEGKEWVYADLRVWNPWQTKYANAAFFIQFALSFKGWIPIPYVSLSVKIVPWYFQFGLGWADELRPDGSHDAVLCAKFRFVNEVKSNEAVLNYSDVLGYYEGTN